MLNYDKELTSVDLFCGGGGSSTGFHQAGFRSKAAFDINAHCVETYNSNYPGIAELQDISTLRAEKILEKIKEPPALVTASPPCEPYTSANENRVVDPYMRMFDDPIGRLMIHAIRLIADLDPRFYMIENVMGILDGDGRKLIGDEFKRLDLEEPVFNIIQASQWGIPSERLRVIISNVELEVPNIPPITVNKAIEDLPSPNYPHDFEYHQTIPVPDKYVKKMPTLPQGEGLIYFRGARNKQYQNMIRIHGNKQAPVVMGKSKFVHPYEDRFLTPAEHARLMTFPDDYQYRGTMEQIYDVIGEAVPPKLTYEIGKQFLGHL